MCAINQLIPAAISFFQH
ncbi:hypothetical protein ACNKHR_25310 [Shigella flexneri]